MPMTPEQQSRMDKEQLVIRPIKNGWLVKIIDNWTAFLTVDELLQAVKNWATMDTSALRKKSAAAEKGEKS